MVLPDRPGESEPTTARPRTVVAVIGAATLVVGFAVLAALTSPEPEAGSTTTTFAGPTATFDINEFTVADIVRGPDLEWEQTLIVEDAHPNGLVIHRGGVLLFASTTSSWSADGGPVDAWSSGSGLDWEPHGTVADRGWRGSIRSDGQRVVAVSSSTDGPPILMISDDGLSWTEEAIPASPTEGESVVLSSGALNQQGAVVAGSTYFDSTGRLREHLQSEYGINLDEMGYGWEFRNGDVHYMLQGPLGLPVMEITGVELGMTPEQVEQAAGREHSDPVVSVWANPGGEGWVEGEIPEIDWLSSVLVGPDGWFVAHGWGMRGSVVSRSGDGLTWETTEQPAIAPDSLIRWRSGFAGISSTQMALQVSPDAVDWERQPIEPSLPSGLRWGFDQLSGGDSGIGMIATSWVGFHDEAPRRPVVVFAGDVQIDFDIAAGTVIVQSGETTRSFSTYSSTLPDWVRLELGTQSLSILDETTEEVLARFTFDELRDIETTFWSSGSGDQMIHAALLFSPDGSNWWVDDFREDVGEDAFVVGMAITSDSIVLVTVDQDLYLSAPSTPGFEIWTASLP